MNDNFYLLIIALCYFSEAHKYFVEYIAKAYQALTDPISRENFEKYGHPDGRQVINFCLLERAAIYFNANLLI